MLFVIVYSFTDAFELGTYELVNLISLSHIHSLRGCIHMPRDTFSIPLHLSTYLSTLITPCCICELLN